MSDTKQPSEDDGLEMKDLITDPSFQKGIRERLGRRMAGLHILKDAIGTADHHRMLGQHAKHVERSWRMGMHALGFHDTEELDKGIDEEEMGDVSVNGDTVINIAPETTHHKPNGTQPAQPSQGNNWLPWALAAGLAAANLGGAAYLVNSQDTTIVRPQDKGTIGLTVTDE